MLSLSGGNVTNIFGVTDIEPYWVWYFLIIGFLFSYWRFFVFSNYEALVRFDHDVLSIFNSDDSLKKNW